MLEAGFIFIAFIAVSALAVIAYCEHSQHTQMMHRFACLLEACQKDTAKAFSEMRSLLQPHLSTTSAIPDKYTNQSPVLGPTGKNITSQGQPQLDILYERKITLDPNRPIMELDIDLADGKQSVNPVSEGRSVEEEVSKTSLVASAKVNGRTGNKHSKIQQ